MTAAGKFHARIIMNCSPGYNAQVEENLIFKSAEAWCRTALNLPPGHSLQFEALRVEASHRSFYRLKSSDQAQTLVLMLSPPALENNDQFLRLAVVFGDHGLPVPKVISSNLSSGYFLLQDLGSQHLQDVYGTAAQDQALTAAIETLVQLSAVQDQAIPPYTAERLATELELFDEWFVQKFLQQQLDSTTFRSACTLLVESAEQQPRSCVHRDYHCRNLMYQNSQLGIVDFQDALRGPALYDIASLLRDCYHTFDEAEIDQWLHLYVRLSPALEALPYAQVKQWFDYLAVQRQLKAIGIFARLHLRDSKSSHLAEIRPLLLRLLDLTAQYPDLEALNVQLKQINAWAQAHPALIQKPESGTQ
jgi:N-acetylmuramate 1-kinase